MFSAAVLTEFSQPHNMAPLPAADAEGCAGTPGCGPYMLIYLKVQQDRIETAHFQTYGCPAVIACGSWLTRWAEGRTLAEASKIEANDLRIILGGLPAGKEHCPELAVGALQNALSQITAGSDR